MTDPLTAPQRGGRRLSGAGRREPPLVSIVCVFCNARDEIAGVIDSILAQATDRIEIIVVDGGSTDGTRELLREFDARLDYWVSEPDRGIYDAMNKGVAAATGTYLLHLNAGDRLLRMPLERLDQAAARRIDVVGFAVRMPGWGEFRARSGWLLRIENTLHHQGTFYRRTAHPGYDTGLRVFADFDANQKLLQAGASMVMHRELVAEQLTVGVSADPGAAAEKIQVVRRNFGAAIAALAIAWRAAAPVLRALKRALTAFESATGPRPQRQPPR